MSCLFDFHIRIFKYSKIGNVELESNIRTECNSITQYIHYFIVLIREASISRYLHGLNDVVKEYLLIEGENFSTQNSIFYLFRVTLYKL
jgi:hypothetical protein